MSAINDWFNSWFPEENTRWGFLVLLLMLLWMLERIFKQLVHLTRHVIALRLAIKGEDDAEFLRDSRDIDR